MTATLHIRSAFDNTYSACGLELESQQSSYNRLALDDENELPTCPECLRNAHKLCCDSSRLMREHYRPYYDMFFRGSEL